MFDFYALPNDFPGYDKLIPGMNPYTKVKLLEEEFKQDIGHHNFIPYIQLHEFEALLFVDPVQLEYCYFKYSSKTTELLATLEKFQGNPELINDGENTAPSKRLISFYPDYEHDKIFAGNLILEAIGIPKLRNACNRFDEWLTKLENLR